MVIFRAPILTTRIVCDSIILYIITLILRTPSIVRLGLRNLFLLCEFGCDYDLSLYWSFKCMIMDPPLRRVLNDDIDYIFPLSIILQIVE